MNKQSLMKIPDNHMQSTVSGSCGKYWGEKPSAVNGGYITASKDNTIPCGTCLKVTR